MSRAMENQTVSLDHLWVFGFVALSDIIFLSVHVINSVRKFQRFRSHTHTYHVFVG